MLKLNKALKSSQNKAASNIGIKPLGKGHLNSRILWKMFIVSLYIHQKAHASNVLPQFPGTHQPLVSLTSRKYRNKWHFPDLAFKPSGFGIKE